MIWSSRTILCIARIQWKATKTPVSTPPLGELVCEGWGWGCAPEGRMARPGSLCVCGELSGGRGGTMEAGVADPWKASFILATAVGDTWAPFFFPKRKFWEAWRVDTSTTETQLVWLGGLWPHDVLFWGLCSSCGAQEERRGGKVPPPTHTHRQ